MWCSELVVLLLAQVTRDRDGGAFRLPADFDLCPLVTLHFEADAAVDNLTEARLFTAKVLATGGFNRPKRLQRDKRVAPQRFQ